MLCLHMAMKCYSSLFDNILEHSAPFMTCCTLIMLSSFSYIQLSGARINCLEECAVHWDLSFSCIVLPGPPLKKKGVLKFSFTCDKIKLICLFMTKAIPCGEFPPLHFYISQTSDLLKALTMLTLFMLPASPECI
jgi:hypothetical protein